MSNHGRFRFFTIMTPLHSTAFSVHTGCLDYTKPPRDEMTNDSRPSKYGNFESSPMAAIDNFSKKIDSLVLGRHFKRAGVLSFFFGSLTGVLLDLCIFQLAIYFGFSPLFANITSSGVAIIITYLFVSRYTFDRKFNARRFSVFFIYYSLSISAFSVAIDYLIGTTELHPLTCKILSLPISFMVNFFFSKKILGKQ